MKLKKLLGKCKWQKKGTKIEWLGGGETKVQNLPKAFGELKISKNIIPKINL